MDDGYIPTIPKAPAPTITVDLLDQLLGAWGYRIKAVGGNPPTWSWERHVEPPAHIYQDGIATEVSAKARALSHLLVLLLGLGPRLRGELERVYRVLADADGTPLIRGSYDVANTEHLHVTPELELVERLLILVGRPVGAEPIRTPDYEEV